MKWGGYDSVTSWLVSVYCCIVFTLNLIPYRLIGLIYVSFIEHYETNRETASIPIVMYMVVNCILSPFSGMVGQRVGIENMLIVGSFLSCAGIGGCYFARDIIGVSFFLGILYAFGLACTNPFLPSIIKKHFTRNFTTANGIYYSGSSLISIIVPPIAYFILDLYNVGGTFLIVSGIMLHSLPVSLLIRNASKMQAKIQKLRKLQSKGQNESSKLILSTEINTKNKLECEKECDFAKELIDVDSQHDSIEVGTNSIEKRIEENSLQNMQIVISKNSSGSKDITAVNQDKFSESTSSRLNSLQQEDKEHSVPLITSDPNVKGYPFVPVENHAIPQNSKAKPKRKFFNFSVFKEPTYLLIVTLYGVYAYVCVLSWTTMLDYSRDKNIARKYEKLYLMLQPLSGLAGRLGLGWVVDRKYISQNTYLILCFLLMALSTVCMIWAHNFELLMTAILIFGVGSGSAVTIFPGLVYKFVKEKNQTVAQASKSSLSGILIFTSTPLIGYFRGNLGSYDGLYYLIVALCLLCCILVPVLFKLSRTVKEEKVATKETEKI